MKAKAVKLTDRPAISLSRMENLWECLHGKVGYLLWMDEGEARLVHVVVVGGMWYHGVHMVISMLYVCSYTYMFIDQA